MSSVSPARDTAHRREPPRLARRLDGLAHHVHVAGRLERVVRPEAAGLLPDPVDRVVARDTCLRRAVVASLGEPLLGEVDRDDALRAREACADHGAQPDEAATEDDARRAGWTAAV